MTRRFGIAAAIAAAAAALASMVVVQPATAAPADFSDVSVENIYHGQITWLAEEGISTGWLEDNGTRTFRPLDAVNRDAMAAFMYRLAGEPPFTPPTRSPFYDVATNNQFYKEITWLAAEGISTGWPDAQGKSFRPIQPVNRDAMAAFLYRYAGSPAYTPPTSSAFKDVAKTNQFYKEISWLAATGISTGWRENSSESTFRPVQSVARDAMAVFMFRYAHLEIWGDGDYLVGSDVEPGTYVTVSSTDGCYWERLSSFDGEFESILANDIGDGQRVVAIEPNDYGFSATRCGGWMSAENAPALSAVPGDGMVLVGQQVAPGLYRASNESAACYWATLSGFSGEFSEIIANGNEDGQAIVRIPETAAGFESARCGTWTRIGD